MKYIKKKKRENKERRIRIDYYATIFIYRPSDDHHDTQKGLVLHVQQYGESIYTFLLQDRIMMQHTEFKAVDEGKGD